MVTITKFKNLQFTKNYRASLSETKSMHNFKVQSSIVKLKRQAMLVCVGGA
jgi:hypothetical protein